MTKNYIPCPISDILEITSNINKHEIVLVNKRDRWKGYVFDEKKDIDEFIDKLIKARCIIFGRD